MESSLTIVEFAIYVRASSEALHSSMPIFHPFRKIFMNPFFAFLEKDVSSSYENILSVHVPINQALTHINLSIIRFAYIRQMERL